MKPQNVEPIDYIAALVLGGGLILHALGKGDVITPMMVAIVFYYFGKKGRSQE